MKQLIAVVLLLLSFAACNNSTAPSTSDISAKPNRDTLIHNIEVLEQQINTQQTVDYNFAAELVAAYLNFFNNYPKDDMAADYLFKAGDVSMNIKQGEKAIEFFQKLIDLYPNYKKASFALFLQGFIYETQLRDMTKAKEIYTQVIEQYPNTRIAEDSKASIANLGKSDEELIKEFEEKNKKK
jgi:outer membrane protein assembly factor BamD (BamD/ComL family)